MNLDIASLLLTIHGKKKYRFLEKTVDVYFGPKAPKGKEGNWIPTAKGRRFFLLFRFYGPTPAAFDGS
jgi:hypothetical protein